MHFSYVYNHLVNIRGDGLLDQDLVGLLGSSQICKKQTLHCIKCQNLVLVKDAMEHVCYLKNLVSTQDEKMDELENELF